MLSLALGVGDMAVDLCHHQLVIGVGVAVCHPCCLQNRYLLPSCEQGIYSHGWHVSNWWLVVIIVKRKEPKNDNKIVS